MAFDFEGFSFQVDPRTSLVEWTWEGDEPNDEVIKRAQHHWWYVLEPQPEADNYDDKWYDLRDGE